MSISTRISVRIKLKVGATDGRGDMIVAFEHSENVRSKQLMI